MTYTWIIIIKFTRSSLPSGFNNIWMVERRLRGSISSQWRYWLMKIGFRRASALVVFHLNSIFSLQLSVISRHTSSSPSLLCIPFISITLLLWRSPVTVSMRLPHETDDEEDKDIIITLWCVLFRWVDLWNFLRLPLPSGCPHQLCSCRVTKLHWKRRMTVEHDHPHAPNKLYVDKSNNVGCLGLYSVHLHGNQRNNKISIMRDHNRR